MINAGTATTIVASIGAISLDLIVSGVGDGPGVSFKIFFPRWFRSRLEHWQNEELSHSKKQILLIIIRETTKTRWSERNVTELTCKAIGNRDGNNNSIIGGGGDECQPIV